MGVLVVAIAVAACGGGGGSSSSSGGATSADTGATGTGGEGGNTAALAEAKEEIAEFIGRPSPFPVTEKLKELPPKGAKVAMLLSGTPVGAILAEAAEEAEKPLGVDVITIKAGPSAALAQSGADAAVAMHPDAVLDVGVSLELLGKQIKELTEAGIPIVTVGELDTEQYGIKNPQAAGPWAEQNGRLMADYVAAEFGTDSNVVFYGVPELGFSAVEEEAFNKQLGKVCPNVRCVASASRSQKSAPRFRPGGIRPAGQPGDERHRLRRRRRPDRRPAGSECGRYRREEHRHQPSSDGPSVHQGRQGGGGAEHRPAGRIVAADGPGRARDHRPTGTVGACLRRPPGHPVPASSDITVDPSKGWTGYPDYKDGSKSSGG